MTQHVHSLGRAHSLLRTTVPSPQFVVDRFILQEQANGTFSYIEALLLRDAMNLKLGTGTVYRPQFIITLFLRSRSRVVLHIHTEFLSPH